MNSKFLFAVVALDHALVWKNSLASGTDPIHVNASIDNPQYRKQHNANAGGRDRSLMHPTFAEQLAIEFSEAEHIYIVSAGTGKANSAHQLVDYLKAKHPEIVQRILGTGTADVNSLSNNQLLELARDREARFMQMG